MYLNSKINVFGKIKLFGANFNTLANGFLPSIQAPWRRRNDVSLWVPATSQVRPSLGYKNIFTGKIFNSLTKEP